MKIYVVLSLHADEWNIEWVGTDEEEAFDFNPKTFGSLKITIETWENGKKIEEKLIKS